MDLDLELHGCFHDGLARLLYVRLMDNLLVCSLARAHAR